MAPLLVLLFLIVPLIEIWVILQVGSIIGGWPTFFLLVAESLVGAYFVKREGARAWRSLRSAIREARMPGRELLDSALVLIGGTLLLTPGFVTDAIGFLLVLPLTRPVTRRVLLTLLVRRFGAAGLLLGAWGGGSPRERPGPSSAGRPRVVEGEVLRDDPPDRPPLQG